METLVMVAVAIGIYFLGSHVLSALTGNRELGTSTTKFFCPHCSYQLNWFWQIRNATSSRIPCPHCRQTIQIKRPPSRFGQRWDSYWEDVREWSLMGGAVLVVFGIAFGLLRVGNSFLEALNQPRRTAVADSLEERQSMVEDTILAALSAMGKKYPSVQQRATELDSLQRIHRSVSASVSRGRTANERSRRRREANRLEQLVEQAEDQLVKRRRYVASQEGYQLVGTEHENLWQRRSSIVRDHDSVRQDIAAYRETDRYRWMSRFAIPVGLLMMAAALLTFVTGLVGALFIAGLALKVVAAPFELLGK